LRKSDLGFEITVTDNEEGFVAALTGSTPDIILSDFSLPTFDGLSAFRIRTKLCPETPFIIVSGTIGEERAVELIKSGITDYALKEKMYVVPPKIRRALDEASARRLKLQAEKELETSRRQLQKVMDRSQDLICTIAMDGTFVNASAASCRVLGYTPEELTGRNVNDLVHPADRELVRSCVEQRASHFEHRIIRKDGSAVPIFWSVRWNDAEGMSYCVARDVSVIKKAEQDLAEKHDQIRSILESITDGFYSVDREWRIQHWNRQAEILLGRKSSAVLGRNLWKEFGEGLPETFVSKYHEAMEQGHMVSFEEFFPPLNMWFSVDAYPSKEGLSVFFRDITEQKRQTSVISLEREVLKVYTTQGSTIEQCIRLLFDGIREIHPGLHCSILKQRDGKLIFWQYSQLDPAYRAAIEPLEIAVGATASGTAAFTKEKAVVSDISVDPAYVQYRSLATGAGLMACTAYPLIDPYRKLLGTFSIYLEAPRTLTVAEEATVERAKYILENILENFLSERRLRESEENYRALFQKSPALLKVFDPVT
ncbi:MAG TPA: PAS domain S-box protein, partial [Sphingobacteriaceae bacterium]